MTFCLYACECKFKNVNKLKYLHMYNASQAENIKSNQQFFKVMIHNCIQW